MYILFALKMYKLQRWIVQPWFRFIEITYYLIFWDEMQCNYEKYRI